MPLLKNQLIVLQGSSSDPVPMTAGIPYSRATMAAWEAISPASATAAAARWNSGVQDGFV